MDSNIVSFIHAFGILQGLVLGAVLLFINKKHKSTLFLGLFLIGFAIEFLPILLEDLKILKGRPGLILIPINLTWIIFPLFFIYVQKISIFSNERITYRVLYPGVLSIIFQIFLYFLPDSSKDFLRRTHIFDAYFILGLIYSGYIVYRINIYIKHHTHEVRNQFASDKNRQLQWVRFFAAFCLALVAVRIGTLFIDDNDVLDLFISFINLIFVFSIAIVGIIQYNVISAVQKYNAVNKESDLKKEVPSEKVLDLINRIDEYVIDHEIFTKQDLSVVNIASALNEHPRDISIAINKHYNKNFNTYINEFRVSKAKKLLRENVLSNLSVEGLSREVGFHSKASFYASFKKVTGTTPKNYMEEMMVN